MTRGRAALAGPAASIVFLGGALVMSYAQRQFMNELGWDVWPSGLALGPHGWGQILVFLVFAALYIAFARHAVGQATWSRSARWGARLLLVGACITPLLAFKTDPTGHSISWHGALHAAGYVALVLSMLIAFVTLLPGLVRRRASGWRLAPVALLLIPFAWVAPNDEAQANYLFFAVPFTVLTAMAIVLASDREPRVA
jgi:hypothetical protein